MKPIYNWTREIAPDRLRMLDTLKMTWEHVFGEPGGRGHYARIQWCGLERDGYRYEKFEATIDGRPVKVHLRVLTAREWFAREVYNRALAATRERYPDFEAHHFVDGDRLGERRICFESETNGLSSNFLFLQLWRIITEQELQVSETWFTTPCDRNGFTSVYTPCGPVSEDHRHFTVVRAVDKMTKEQLEQLVSEIKENGVPTVSDDKLAFDWEDIEDDLVELSDPELVALNWEDARPAPTPADLALDQAICGLDVGGIRKALADGANPNHTDRYNCNRLSSVIYAWWDHIAHYEAPEEELDFYSSRGPRPERKIPVAEIREIMQMLLDAGAHPNLFAYGELTALADTVGFAKEPELVRLLLAHGADPSISPYWCSIAETPAAWESVMLAGFQILDEAGSRECYYEMVKEHPSPYGSRSEEERDRRDAELPDHLRYRTKHS